LVPAQKERDRGRANDVSPFDAHQRRMEPADGARADKLFLFQQSRKSYIRKINRAGNEMMLLLAAATADDGKTSTTH